jgi:hypothetical protein
MRTIGFLSFTVSLFLLGCECGAEQTSEVERSDSVEGSWELVSATWYFEDSAHFPNSVHDRALKIFGEKDFVFIRQDITDDGIYFSGAGSYSYEDSNYSEKLEMASFTIPTGETYTYSSEFKNDMWSISGPVATTGAELPDWTIHEEWKRIK